MGIRKILGSNDQIVSILRCMKGLQAVNETIRVQTPISAEWFLSLPDVTRYKNQLGVYALVFEKGIERRVYIGSAISMRGGLGARMDTYQRFIKEGIYEFIPQAVVEIVTGAGFKLAHTGTVFSVPKTAAIEYDKMACIMLTLETMVALQFGGMDPGKNVYAHLNRFPAEKFDFVGPCSHPAVRDIHSRKLSGQAANLIALNMLAAANLQKKGYREQNHVRILERERAYREQNHVRISKQQKAYREQNHARISKQKKAYHEQNYARISKQKKAYREQNHARISKQKKVYYQQNHARISKQQKAYREQNHARILERERAYRERSRTRRSGEDQQKRPGQPGWRGDILQF